ncbi:DUF3793 family protein [Sporomusa sp.]|uniref:DUF3793 family protein n=1 Tax=Sporomusa sp. TaxID=2078658 RepID=UPI002BD263E7|nr:DUF3793 family protein [Sporomusa sp.]HWR44681.1 DUF3793 family protein [Sporomusa sp.]
MLCMQTGESLLKLENQNTPSYFFKWLVVELAPTIYGEKPATLLTFADSRRFLRLTFWRKFGPTLLRQSEIEWATVRETANSLTVLFYHPDSLAGCLRQTDHCRFLSEFGYKPDCPICENMDCLKKRYQNGCPHEIGLLLGIPLKDVLGFMGQGEECLSCRGMWCIYGDPAPSLRAMEKIDECKTYAANLLNYGASPRSILLEKYCKTA